MATSVVFPRVQFFSNNGRPLIGGCIHTYVAGSSTRARTYKDAAMAQPNANPIILDARGEAAVYLAEGVEYKFVVEDNNGALIMTQQPVYGAIWPNAKDWPSDATLSYQYMTEAKAVADAVSVAEFYDTYAQALAAAAGARRLVEIARDETRDGARTRYWAQAGALGFVVNLDQLRSDLGSAAEESKNSALVGFRQSGANAAARTVQSKERDIVSDFDFMTPAQIADVKAGTLTKDVTAACQAAINAVSASGGAVYAPGGNRKLSAALAIPATGVALYGASRLATRFTQHSLASKIINATGAFFCLAGLSLGYAGTPTAGATAIYSEGSYSRFNDFAVMNSSVGVHLKNGVAQNLTNFELLDYESIGLHVESLNDAFVSKAIINAGTEARGALGGIRLTNKVEAFVCCDVDVLLGVWSMTTDGVYSVASRPAYNNFTNVFFDSSAKGVSLEKMVETEFVGCWFSGGRSGAGNPGCTINQCDSLTFTNTRFFNNGGNGCAVTSSAARTHFIGCKFESNSVTSGVGVAHGLFFANGSADFLVQGCIAHNGLFGGRQAYGIFIGAGCEHFNVSDNNVRGNATGGIFDGSNPLSDKKVGGNIGYRTTNVGATTILEGTSSIVVQHGLGVTPAQYEIMLTRGSGNQGSTDLSVTAITATTFTIVTAAAPSGNMVVNWQARCAGA